MLDKAHAMAPVGPQGTPSGLGQERTAQQTITVQRLDPLGIADIVLATRYILDMARVHHLHLETTLLQELIYGNPVDPGAFHGHALDAAGLQPVSQSEQIGRVRAKAADGLFCALTRHAGPDLGLVDV